MSKSDFLQRYFPHSVEYPDPTKVMLEPGWLLSYIDSTFLGGWVNHVKILDAYLITRYQSHSVNLEQARAFDQRVDAGEITRQNLSGFGDDVLVLARENPSNRPSTDYQYDLALGNRYWFFWFDQDSSDCCIGRFDSETSPDMIRQEFRDYCFAGPTTDLGDNQEIAPEFREPIYLRLNQVKGWLGG